MAIHTWVVMQGPKWYRTKSGEETYFHLLSADRTYNNSVNGSAGAQVTLKGCEMEVTRCCPSGEGETVPRKRQGG